MKQLRVILLSLGICFLVLSAALVAFSVFLGNADLTRIALLYAPAGACCIGLRSLLIWIKNRRKHRVRAQRQKRSEITSQA
jgi:hypothetical protein